MEGNQKKKRTEIADLGEFGLIAHLTKSVVLQQKSSLKGVGDDAAVIQCMDECFLVTTDLLIEGIHFDLMYCPLKHLGYKAVIVNLSDICAMNAKPAQITVSIGISNRFSLEAVDEIFDGIKLACKLYDVDLVGGDTSSSVHGLIISITAIGLARREDIVYRSGARENDIICVSGDLGAAYLGLQLLEREKHIFQSNPEIQPDLEDQQYVLQRQLKPEARSDVIDNFKKFNLLPSSMIDISDGLASDLFHICNESETGAYLEESKIPLHPDTEQMALKFGLDPTVCALNGGEDYELLFTVRPDDLEKIRYIPSVYIIGEIVRRSDGVTLHTPQGKIHPIKAQGWQHFDAKK